MGKNIVICLDGTDEHIRSSGSTNVVFAYDMLEHEDPTRQIGYYSTGVGTPPIVGTYTPAGQLVGCILGSAFGIGLRAKLADAYLYLVDNWQPGDSIFIFGYSRGAFCARGLAGLVNSVGILRPGARNLVPEAISEYAQVCDNWSPAKWNELHSFARILAHRQDGKVAIPIAYLGLWDTVSAPGIFKRSMEWPYAPSVPNALAGRHAVAIDEKRRAFRDYLIAPINGVRKVEEAWFAGIHSNIGGGKINDTRLSTIALNWVMQGAVNHGLIVNHDKYQRYCRVQPSYALGKIHSLSWWWALLTYQHRRIPDRAWIHASVVARMQQDSAYRPQLPEETMVIDSQWASPTGDISL